MRLCPYSGDEALSFIEIVEVVAMTAAGGRPVERGVLPFEERGPMRDSWLELVDCVLRPARPHLERCMREREEHLAARRLVDEERARAIASCERRIESARAVVFAANDGVVGARMTNLEREWRLLSRPDPERGLMDSWARIAPASWIDRKRWRDDRPASRLDAAIALAADAEGVEAAEGAIGSFREALAPWGIHLATRIQWRSFDRDADCTTDLLVEPLRAARQAVSVLDVENVVCERAERLEREVYEAACVRFPERALLARALGRAAFVDYVWRAASFVDRPNPVTPLRALWKAGYVLSGIDDRGVIVELPAL
jgi:hypothetical protein